MAGGFVSEAALKAFDFLKRRKLDYQQTFSAPCGERVLLDLAKFCRANDTTFHLDPRVHAALEGRREVFLRIVHHLKLPSEELYKLWNPGGPT